MQMLIICGETPLVKECTVIKSAFAAVATDVRMILFDLRCLGHD